MMRLGPATVALGAAALALVAATLGFLLGLADPRGGEGPRGDAQQLPGSVAARDPALALRTLDTYGHWGRYIAPEPQESTLAASRQARPSAPIGSLARAWRLVGIERRGGTRVVVLLPADSEAAAAEEIRLGLGEVLAEDIRVSEIGVDSVRFATPEGEAVLHLYGSES